MAPADPRHREQDRDNHHRRRLGNRGEHHVVAVAALVADPEQLPGHGGKQRVLVEASELAVERACHTEEIEFLARLWDESAKETQCKRASLQVGIATYHEEIAARIAQFDRQRASLFERERIRDRERADRGTGCDRRTVFNGEVIDRTTAAERAIQDRGLPRIAIDEQRPPAQFTDTVIG